MTSIVKLSRPMGKRALTVAASAGLALSLSACVYDPYPPAAPAYYSTPAYSACCYSYYDFPPYGPYPYYGSNLTFDFGEHRGGYGGGGYRQGWGGHDGHGGWR